MGKLVKHRVHNMDISKEAIVDRIKNLLKYCPYIVLFALC